MVFFATNYVKFIRNEVIIVGVYFRKYVECLLILVCGVVCVWCCCEFDWVFVWVFFGFRERDVELVRERVDARFF